MTRKTTLLLVGESFSPWTKKARWALEQCALPYKYQEYTPTLSEPGLRWRMRQWTGSISVPVLFADGTILRGSWNIAQFANQTAGDNRLGNFEEYDYWNTLSEAALAQGRTNLVRRIVKNDKALEEALPAFVPTALRQPLRFLARDAVSRLDRKYAHLVEPTALYDALAATREALAKSDGDYLSGAFSYADISMATVLEVISPIAEHTPPLGAATQQCWVDDALAAEFADLLEWRDRLAEAEATTYSQFAYLRNT